MSNSAKVKENNTYSGSISVLAFGLSVVTLYFNTKANDPFNTPKLILLLILSGWLLGHVFKHYHKRNLKVSKKEFIYLTVAISFISAQLFALYFTDIFVIGLIGDTQRRNGFLSYLSLVAILVFCMVSVNYYYALRIMKSAILLGLVLCTYGLLQVTGNDFVSWDNPYNSMIATVGNPNFASSLLAIVTLISLFSLVNKQFSSIYKSIATIVVLTSIGLIINSQSRQGLLVIAFALVFYLTTYILLNSKKFKFKIIVVVAATMLSSLAVLGMLQIGPLTSILYKNSVTVRGYYWRAAWKMFLDKPLTGVGLDRYGAYFKEFREPSYSLNYGFDITSSNAHNVYLQLLSTGGIFVGLTYLLLLVVIFYAGLQNLRNSVNDTQKFNLLILSSWIGFQAQALISIDNIGISVWGWVLGGCILGINLNSRNEELTGNEKKGKSVNQINLFQPVISTLILIPIILFSYNLYKIETNTFLAKSYADINIPNNAKTVYTYSNDVINNPIADPYYKLLVSLYIADMGYTQEAYNSLIALNKKDPRNLDVLRVLVEYEKSNYDVSKEIKYRNQIADLDPWNAVNYFDLGKLYKQQGDVINALRMKEKILSFASNTEVGNLAKVELN